MTGRVNVELTPEGLRVITHADGYLAARICAISLVTISLALYSIFPAMRDVFVVRFFGGFALVVVILLWARSMRSEKLEMSLGNCVITRWPFYRKLFNLTDVRGLQAIQRLTYGWSLVFNVREADYSACRDLDKPTIELIRDTIIRLFPGVTQPMVLPRLGLDQLELRRSRLREVHGGVKYRMPPTTIDKLEAAAISAVMVGFGFLYLWPQKGSANSKPGLAIGPVLQMVALLLPYTIKLAICPSIEVNATHVICDERPLDRRVLFPRADIIDIRSAEWSLSLYLTPLCAIEVVHTGGVKRMFEGLPRLEAMALAEELRAAFGLLKTSM